MSLSFAWSCSLDLSQWTREANGASAQHVQAGVQWRGCDVGETLEILWVWGSQVCMTHWAQSIKTEAAGPQEDRSAVSDIGQSFCLHPVTALRSDDLALSFTDGGAERSETRYAVQHQMYLLEKAFSRLLCADCITYPSAAASLKTGEISRKYSATQLKILNVKYGTQICNSGTLWPSKVCLW